MLVNEFLVQTLERFAWAFIELSLFYITTNRNKESLTYLHSFLYEQIKLGLRLAVLNFSQIFRLNCSEFVLKISSV